LVAIKSGLLAIGGASVFENHTVLFGKEKQE
jgi:hypothetical protein